MAKKKIFEFKLNETTKLQALTELYPSRYDYKAYFMLPEVAILFFDQNTKAWIDVEPVLSKKQYLFYEKLLVSFLKAETGREYDDDYERDDS